MRDQYRQNMELVHAPKDLIERTKIAMRREEELLKEKKQKRKIPIIFIPATMAAAALLFGLIFMQSFRERTLFGSEAEMNQGAVLLEQFELTPEKIIPGMTKAEKEFQFYIIQDFPKEFLSDMSFEEVVDEIPVRFVKDDKTGFYKAVFQSDSDSRKYLVISQTVNKELVKQAIKCFLGSFEETVK